VILLRPDPSETLRPETLRDGRGRVLVVLVVLGTIAVAVWLQFAAVLDAVTPGAVEVSDAGPVLVLGGKAERMDLAFTLPGIDAGTRPLVASAAAVFDLVALGHDCDEPQFRCMRPDPFSTRGEAVLAARLADEDGWTELTVVTSWWHVHRASLHLRACLDIPFRMLAARGSDEPPTPGELLKEVVGSIDARLRPECR
jgi:hypothetical protein